MTIEKIQCEHCSSSILNTNIRKHQRTKKCQKVQEKKRQSEQQSPVKERKESKDEKIECKCCGTKVMSKNMNTHMKSKKCLSIRELKEQSNLYKCKWCNQCFQYNEELSEHRDVCLKGKIYHLKQELYIEKENNQDLIEQHKFEMKEQEEKLRREMKEQEEKLRREMKEQEEKLRGEMKEREEKLRGEMKEREEKFERELKSKDDFIKTLAKEPKYVSNTNNHNNFNLSNYFKGNNGIDFDEKLLEIENCKSMLLDVLNKHLFSDMKKIREIKEKQIDLLCKDEKTKKWNVVKTDTSRNTFTVCKRDNDRVLTVKDPDGKMIKTIIDKMDKSNKHSLCGVLAKNLHLEDDMFRELEDNYKILVKESLWDKIPTKAMLSEQEQFDCDNITIE